MNQFKGAKIAYVVFALVIFSLVVNIVYLGITGKHLISGSDIKTYAKNRGKSESIEYATRGSIYTSDNEVIAKSVRNFKLSAVVSKKREGKNAYVKDIKKTAQEVAPIIGMDPNEMEQKMQEAVDAGKYQIEFGTYGNNLTMGQKTEIEKKDLPGLVFEEVNTRNYPLGDFSSYIVGYAKNTTDEDGVKKLVGEMGIERNYDEVLAGKNGYRVYEKTADGYVRTNGILKKKDAVNGKDIYLTLNSSLQRDLDYLLAKEAGEAGASNASCVVMEAKTGKILALSTYPSFDPNKRDIKGYNNFFFDSAYECGSVFKSFVYASSIESGLYNGSALYQSGKYDYGASRPIRDHNNGVGSVSYTHLAVNKIDDGAFINDIYDFYSLGIGDPIPVSGSHGIGIGDLLDEVIKKLDFTEEEFAEDEIRFSIIGRPNVGKSSLTNAILGEERVIVSNIEGTTRDAIDTVFEKDGQKYRVIDTAGMRKKGKIYENVEKYSVLRALSSIEKSDVIVVVIDGERGVIEQDKHVAGYAHEAGKGVILVVNKWDLVEKDEKTMQKKEKELRSQFKYLDYARIIFLSAKTHQRVHQLFPLIQESFENSHKRVQTSVLNDVLVDAQAVNPTTTFNGGRLKIFYANQVSVCPPTFILFVNDPQYLHFSYKRYLENRLRDSFGFEGTPIHIICRKRD